MPPNATITVEHVCSHAHTYDTTSRDLAARATLGALLALGAWLLLYRNLPRLARWGSVEVLGCDPRTQLGTAVEFLAYEVPKVLLLLGLVVFVVGVIRSYCSPHRTRELLVGRREAVGNVLAAGLGVVTPFCSCSAVPLFLGFVEAGVPLGVTFSFLISAPMVNEVALVLLLGLFGWRVALLYLSTGLLLAMLAGWVIGRLRLEHWVEPWVYAVQLGEAAADQRWSWPQRLAAGRAAVREIVGRVWPYVLAGIAVGAGIHGYVPDGVLAAVMGREAWWSVPLAVLLGVPMYSNAAGIIPIVEALLGKGAALGTVLAFMMAVIALSLPEAIILRKVLQPKLIATFFGVVASGILLVGWLFNLLF
ncbi:MAG: permease [Fimbriimonadaceae bacterium]|nr:permease [Fimbriimonadaceae bacterium]